MISPQKCQRILPPSSRHHCTVLVLSSPLEKSIKILTSKRDKSALRFGSFVDVSPEGEEGLFYRYLRDNAR